MLWDGFPGKQSKRKAECGPQDQHLWGGRIWYKRKMELGHSHREALGNPKGSPEERVAMQRCPTPTQFLAKHSGEDILHWWKIRCFSLGGRFRQCNAASIPNAPSVSGIQVLCISSSSLRRNFPGLVSISFSRDTCQL